MYLHIALATQLWKASTFETNPLADEGCASARWVPGNMEFPGRMGSTAEDQPFQTVQINICILRLHVDI
jgi:hypothetical protein